MATPQEMMAQQAARIAQLEAALAAKSRPSTISYKVSEYRIDDNGNQKGGAVSVYGLQRMPITLYYEQWVRLLDSADTLRSFMETQKKAGNLKLKNGAGNGAVAANGK